MPRKPQMIDFEAEAEQRIESHVFKLDNKCHSTTVKFAASG